MADSVSARLAAGVADKAAVDDREHLAAAEAGDDGRGVAHNLGNRCIRIQDQGVHTEHQGRPADQSDHTQLRGCQHSWTLDTQMSGGKPGDGNRGL